MRTHKSQAKALLRPGDIAFTVAGTTTFLVVMFTVVGWRGNNLVSVYLRDPAASFGFSPLAGMISHLGVFALLTAGAIGIFASFHAPVSKGLLFWAGTFSLLIGVDDFFMVHDALAGRIGLSEIHVLAAYGLFAITIFSAFRSSLVGKSHAGLYVGVMLLAASVAIDALLDYSEVQVMVEDSVKFVGLIVWSSYWVRRAHSAMAEHHEVNETCDGIMRRAVEGSYTEAEDASAPAVRCRTR